MRLRTLITALIMLVLGTPAFAATYEWEATVTVPADLRPNDVHLTFSGTGGTIDDETLEEDPGEDGEISADENEVSIVWEGNLDPGDVIVFTFTTEHDSVEFAGGYWTKNGEHIQDMAQAEVEFEEIAYCPEDIDGDGDVDFDDLLRVLGAWGNAGGPEDIDGSGQVGFGDLLMVLAAWGDCD